MDGWGNVCSWAKNKAICAAAGDEQTSRGEVTEALGCRTPAEPALTRNILMQAQGKWWEREVAKALLFKRLEIGTRKAFVLRRAWKQMLRKIQEKKDGGRGG